MKTFSFFLSMLLGTAEYYTLSNPKSYFIINYSFIYPADVKQYTNRAVDTFAWLGFCHIARLYYGNYYHIMKKWRYYISIFVGMLISGEVFAASKTVMKMEHSE